MGQRYRDLFKLVNQLGLDAIPGDINNLMGWHEAGFKSEPPYWPSAMSGGQFEPGVIELQKDGRWLARIRVQNDGYYGCCHSGGNHDWYLSELHQNLANSIKEGSTDA